MKRHAMLKRVSSLLLVMAMLFSMVSGALAAPSERDGATIIDVTDYGADPSGVRESSTAVIKALQYAKTLPASEPKTISFPEGEYHLYADYSEVRELYVSNTTGIKPTYKNKHIGILVEGMENVTIDGGGSMFIYHGDITAFATIKSKNVTFENFDFDHASPSVVDVTVESKVDGENAVIAYVPPDYSYTISGNTIKWTGEIGPVTGEPYWQGDNNLVYTQIHDTISGKTWRGDNTLFSSVQSIQDMGNNRLKFSYSGSSATPQVGLCFQMRNTTRTTPGTLFWESENVTVRHMNVHFLHGFGFVGQLSKDITLDDVHFATRPGTGRTTAGFADFVQMSSVGGKIDIKNCSFSNPHDDPINIHGTFLTVKSVSADKKTFTVQYQHNETGGFPQYYVGDEVDFSAKGTMVPVADSLRTVTAVENFPGDDRSLITFTVDQPVNGIVGGNESHVVENVTYIPKVEITNNRFIETPTRGILVTTRKPVLIENNYFDAMGMASIYISCDAQEWYESGHTEDVTIRGNTFDRLSAKTIHNNNAILIEPTGRNDPNFQLHKKIVIEDNLFNIEDPMPVVNAKSVEHLVFTRNTINRSNPNVSMTLASGSTSLSVGATQPLTLSATGTSLSDKRLYRFENCKNVSVTDNQYDDGLNQSASLEGGTQTSDVTITGDDVTLDANNIKAGVDSPLYFSTNPAVVSVSSNGIVSAVDAGSADVFAYTASGARVFESNKLTFTVAGGGAAITKPNSLSIKGGTSPLTPGTDVALSVQASPLDASTDVIFSVRDAKTGGASSIATISATGLLHTTDAGAIEVFATSVADSSVTASRLFTVEPNPSEKGNLWTVENDTEDWDIQPDGSLKITAQPGGDWEIGSGSSNVFLTNVADKDDFSVSVKLHNKTASGYEEAGLTIFRDHANYVNLQRKHNIGSPQLAVTTESNSNPSEIPRIDDKEDDAIFLKLEKQDTKIKGYYKLEGDTDWTLVREVNNTTLGNDFKVGILACGSSADTGFTFSDFKINDVPVSFTANNASPTISNVTAALSDGIVKASYDYSDPESNTEGASMFRWYACDTETGFYAPIDRATTQNLTLTSALSNKHVRVAVLPVDAFGSIGAPVLSAAVSVGPVAGTPTDATLSALTFTGAQVSPAFSPEQTNYRLTAPVSATELFVTATATQTDAGVAMQLDGADVADGRIPLDTAKELTVTVTAPDRSSTKTYTISFAHPKSSDANLNSMTLGDVSLAADTQYYQKVITDPSVRALPLSATCANPDARMTVRLNGTVLKSDVYSIDNDSIPLVAGLNALEIRSRAADGISSRIYRVSIITTRANDAALSGLSINGAPLPDFSETTHQYRYNAPANTITVAGTPKDRNATVRVIADGEIYPDGAVPLTKPLTTVSVQVLADNGTTKQTYQVQVVLPTPNDANLLSLSTGSTTLSPVFDAETTAYTATTSAKMLTIDAQSVQSNATLTAGDVTATDRLHAEVPLSVGQNTIALIVTAPDGSTTKTYTLTVTRETFSYLSDLEWVSASAGDASWNSGNPAKDTAWEGKPMSVTGEDGNAATFTKGIGTHANSTIIYDLSGKDFVRFTAKIGASYSQNASTQNYTNLTFRIEGDGTKLFEVTSMKKDTPYNNVDLDITGVRELKLMVSQPSNTYNAHGNWADAKLDTMTARPTHAVAFITNGGSEIAPVQVDDGQTLAKPADPTRDGYTFKGWFTDEALTLSYDFAKPVTAALTLYASWMKNGEPAPAKHTVSFNANGGSEIAPVQVDDGQALAKPADPTRDGYTFKGWFTDEALTLSYDFTKPVTAALTLYASWMKNGEPTPAKHTVSFNANGGSEIAPVQVDDGQALTKPQDPTRSGFRFRGWYADAALTIAYDFAKPVTADLTLYASWSKKSSGGGDSGGGSTGGGTTEPGGSTTTETTKPDGSKETTVVNRDTGETTVTTKATDGGQSTVKTDRDGKVTAEVTLSANAENKAVLPMPDMKPSTSTANAPSVTIKTDKSMTVTIPVADKSDSVVAVIVDKDGKETILPKAVMGENGLQVPVSGQTTIKLVNNQKSFADVSASSWASSAVDFVTSRELFNGTSANSFSPNEKMTRGMLVTVLWRYESKPEGGSAAFGDVGADEYFAQAVAWASSKNIVTGTGAGFTPNGDITREQLAAILYRYAGSPATDSKLDTFGDGGKVSSYASDAMRWAVGTGVISGKNGNLLAPQDSATRAEVAAMLQRFVKASA